MARIGELAQEMMVPEAMDRLARALNTFGEVTSPVAQYKRGLGSTIASGGIRSLSPADIQILFGIPAMSAATQAGYDPFARANPLAPPVSSPYAVGPLIAGMPKERIDAIFSTPSPAAEEQARMDEESLRDAIAKLNNYHVKMNTMLETMGIKDRLPIYDTKKLKFKIPYGQNIKRARTLRAYRQLIGDILEGAQKAMTAMETAFTLGPEAAARTIPESFKGYLGTFPDSTEELQKMLTLPPDFLNPR